MFSVGVSVDSGVKLVPPIMKDLQTLTSGWSFEPQNFIPKLKPKLLVLGALILGACSYSWSLSQRQKFILIGCAASAALGYVLYLLPLDAFPRRISLSGCALNWILFQKCRLSGCAPLGALGF